MKKTLTLCLLTVLSFTVSALTKVETINNLKEITYKQALTMPTDNLNLSNHNRELNQRYLFLVMNFTRRIYHLASIWIKKENNAVPNPIPLEYDCDCPEPAGGHFANICMLVENQDLSYRQEFRDMACVTKTDSPEVIKIGRAHV